METHAVRPLDGQDGRVSRGRLGKGNVKVAQAAELGRAGLDWTGLGMGMGMASKLSSHPSPVGVELGGSGR